MQGCRISGWVRECTKRDVPAHVAPMEDNMQYDVLYMVRGKVENSIGPFPDLSSAIQYASNYAQGFEYLDVHMRIVSRDLSAAWQLIVAKHTCGCSLCPVNGEKFTHVRAE
jgi:hypothetical protein